MNPMNNGIKTFKSVVVNSLEIGVIAGTIGGCATSKANFVLRGFMLGVGGGAVLNVFQNNKPEVAAINGIASLMFSYTASLLAEQMYSHTTFGHLAGLTFISLSSSVAGIYAAKKMGLKIKFKNVVRLTAVNVIVHSAARIFSMIGG